MLKKAIIGIVLFGLVGSLGLFLWARSILAQDTVRAALAGQLSKAVGQPVTIASITASIYPRVTVNLGGVRIGDPARVTVQTLQVGTDFRALLSRQIAHATLRLNGARIELPLAPFPSGSASSSSGSAPVEIVSIDEVVLDNVEIVSGGRTLHGDIEAVPRGSGFTLRKLNLRAEDANVNVTGEITDLAGPVGDLKVTADTLHLDRLLVFVADFSGGAGTGVSQTPATGPAPAPKPAGAAAMNLSVSLDAGRAAIGTMVLDRLTGRARITSQGMTLDPIGFGIFKGRYEGRLGLTPGDTPSFQLNARLSDVDVATAMAFAGSPNSVTGTLSGTIDLAGRGSEATAVARSSRGAVRVDIRDGVVRNLGLLRTVVIATSGRTGSTAQLAGGSSDEPFTRLATALAIADGVATTNDLRFESKDLSLTAAGTIAVNGSAVNLVGQVQLSDALSQQAGRDLVRYTQDQGRVTVPVAVSGSAERLSATIDVKALAARAIRNRANEEIQKTIKGTLGGLFK